MSLETYHHKRDFQRTPEPKGQFEATLGGNDYIIQKHAARRLHYDFRLRIGGVLKSWAVPKGPSLDPKEKRLAVETEDHPLEYASFEGSIPPKNYGAGTVMLWDRGEWLCEGDAAQSYRAGKIKFTLDGERLQGRWTLVKMRGSRSSGKEWLLVKEDDEYASAEEPTAQFSTSVISDRAMEQIAEAPNATENSGARKAGPGKGKRNSKDKRQPGKTASHSRANTQPVESQLDDLQHTDVAPEPRQSGDGSDKWLTEHPKARDAAMPREFTPQLATLYKSVPAGAQWLHEIKYDGYRLLVRKDDAVRFLTRTGKDWTSKFPDIVDAFSELPEAIIDGELVYLTEAGISSFEGLQQVLQSGDTGRLVFYAFDLPFLKGKDLTRVPLLDRKELLADVVNGLGNSRVQFSGHIEGEGDEVYTHACQHGLEGIISKLSSSTYQQARAKTWRKIKCVKRQEFVVVGFTEPQGGRQGFGALLLGYYENASLCYAGKVGTGFKHAELIKLRQQLERLKQAKPTLSCASDEPGVTWLKPQLVAEVEFTEWTTSNRLRHPAFVALRSHKPAQEIVREVPKDAKQPAADDPAGQPRRAPTRAAIGGGKAPGHRSSTAVAGVALSNADKVLYDQAGLTKRDLAEYYASIAEHILPYVANRPLTLVRCPHGHNRHCFFQKHLGDTFDPSVKPIDIAEKRGTSAYAYINDAAGLIGLVQMGTLEIHAWGSRVDAVDKPDSMVFDLDPDVGVGWPEVQQAALDVKEFLEDLGLRSFLRTSGGKGLHVVVPVQRRHHWDEVKAFCKAVAQEVVRQFPERYVATMSKAKRKDKIFIDYLRNGRGATSICNYSSRSKPFAPVATPVEWEELDQLESSQVYNVHTLPDRLRELTVDPWQGYFDVRQSITQPMKKRLKLR